MARNIFNPDGGFMGFFTKLFDIMYLSLIWLLFSIPVITIGASTTALYYTVVKGIRRNRGYIFRNFWKSFKMNFGTATIMWLLVLVIDFLIIYNFRFASSVVSGALSYVIYGADMLIMLIVLFITLYIFPVLSRFQLTKKQLLQNSLIMSIRHLPFTFLMLVIFLAVLYAGYFSLMVFPLFLVLIPVLGCWLYSFPMEHVLKLNTPDTEDNPVDEWFME